MCVIARYLGRKKGVQSVCVQPPFLRPQLTEAQLAAKILDNGIQGDLHRVSLSLLSLYSGLVVNRRYCMSECFAPHLNLRFAYRQEQMAARSHHSQSVGFLPILGHFIINGFIFCRAFLPLIISLVKVLLVFLQTIIVF